MLEKIKNQKIKKINKIYRYISFVLVLLILSIISLSLPGVVKAASLYLSPASGSYQVGKTFSITVYITSSEQAMNAVSGVISFPTDKLEVTSISKSGSIIGLWVMEPSFSNSTGVVNFEGVILNPGFIGSDGKAVSVTFKVKGTGEALVTLSSGLILANDGSGTNILTSLGSAEFNLTESISEPEPSVPEATTPSETIIQTTTNVPPAPKIFSPTHPNQDEWYSDNKATFNWVLPQDVTDVNILADQYENTNPGTRSDGLINTYTYEDVEDGIWYFHSRFKNRNGWGEVSHFRFQIDTQHPEPFKIKFVGPHGLRPSVLFNTTDSLSGIDYYRVKIGESDFESVDSKDFIESNPYSLPPQKPGKKVIIVQAFDRAANYTTDSAEFVVKAIDAPMITEYPKELDTNMPFIVKGTTYPDSEVIIWLQNEDREPKSQKTKSDADGKFIFVADEKLADGFYKMWAEVMNPEGVMSYPTDKYSIVVKPTSLSKIGSWLVNFLSILVPLVALIIFLVFLIFKGCTEISCLKKKVDKGIGKAQTNLYKAFDLLESDIKEQIEILKKTGEKRELTREETAIISQLKKDLNRSEELLSKDIGDIKRRISDRLRVRKK